MPRSVPDQAYKSAFNLPTFRKMQDELKAAKLLGIFMSREVKAKIAQLEKDIWSAPGSPDAVGERGRLIMLRA
jgi:hypothetical protein